jgi:hypothetical protein
MHIASFPNRNGCGDAARGGTGRARRTSSPAHVATTMRAIMRRVRPLAMVLPAHYHRRACTEAAPAVRARHADAGWRDRAAIASGGRLIRV